MLLTNTPYFEADPESDAGYLAVRDGVIAHTIEAYPDVLIDVDEAGYILGIDLQHLSDLKIAL